MALDLANRLAAAALMVVVGAQSLAAGDAHPRWAGEGAVLKGYDAAAYHTAGIARQGAAAHAVTWSGGTFHFASRAAAERFRADPAAMAPSFGGYCTGGLSQGHVVDANPKLFRLYKGRLYVFASPAGPKRFDKDPEGVIRAARAYALKVGVVE